MSSAYDVTVKIRVTAPRDPDNALTENQQWADDGAMLMAYWIRSLVGKQYLAVGGESFQVLSSEAKYLEPATTGDAA